MKQIFLYTSLAVMALAVTTTGAAPERCDGNRFVVHADAKQTAFLTIIAATAASVSLCVRMKS